MRTSIGNLWFRRTRSWHNFDRYATYDRVHDTPTTEYILHLLKCFSIASLFFFYHSSHVSSAFALKFVTIFLPMALDWQWLSGHQCKVNIKNQTKVNRRICKSDGLDCSISWPHCGKSWQRILWLRHMAHCIYFHILVSSWPCSVPQGLTTEKKTTLADIGNLRYSNCSQGISYLLQIFTQWAATASWSI